MAYTINRGVTRETWQKFVRDSGLALPIIAIIFIIIAALSVSTHQSTGQSPYISPKKSVLSATTSDNSSKSDSKHDTDKKPPASKPSPPAEPAMSFGGLDSAAPPISTPTLPLTGGLGGGDPGSDGGTSDEVTPPDSDGDTSAPTVVCTNLLTLAQLCTACTPPLTLQPGQKALLSVDGTCAAVN
jgi:hypothetical protein